jgi:hypothetical protein
MMHLFLLVAAGVLAVVGVAHSYLGERFILMRLFRRADLPHLFGSDVFTRRTLRFAWHLTTIAWWGLGAILVVAAGAAGEVPIRVVLRIVAVTSFVSSVVVLGWSRGRHLAWLAFLAVAVLVWLGAAG